MKTNLRPGPWISQAKCVGHPNPNLWFDQNTFMQARAICRTCPVILECRTYALDNKLTDGVFGGMGEHARKTWGQRLGKP